MDELPILELPNVQTKIPTVDIEPRVDAGEEPVPVPPVIALNVIFFISFCNGQQRAYNMQFFFQTRPKLSNIVFVAVDYINQRRNRSLKSDLLCLDNQAWWLSVLKDPRVIGALFQPPCETMCARRGHGEGPRRLRSSTCISESVKIVLRSSR